ncbi:MAG: hypothetical protein JOZ39_04035 [Chloroflexi bacterium]|nr:hypothetical protein [Chloroflexota bacterium]
MRQWVRLAGVALAFATSFLPAISAQAAGDYQGPGTLGTEYVQVTPADSLSDGQTVMVSGRGFKPNMDLALNMCLLSVRGYSDCDPDTTVMKAAHTAADGSFAAVPFKVQRTVHIPSRHNDALDCSTGACSIGVGDVGGVTGGSHCVGFGGACQPDPAAKSVTSVPSTGGGLPVGPIAGAAAVVIVGGAIAFMLRGRNRAAVA